MIRRMRSGPDRCSPCLPPGSAVLLLAIAVLVANGAGAADGSSSGEDLFLPSVAGVVGLDVREQKGSISSVRGDFEDHDREIFPSLGFDLELMSPSLMPGVLPGAPRLFVNAGLASAFDSDRNVVKEGAPGQPVIPPSSPGTQPPVNAVTGLGSSARSKTDSFLVRAGAGIAFTTALGDRNLWIKPSLVYQRETTHFSTAVSAAQSINNSALCPCRTGFVSAKQSESFDLLGAGLELEMDAGRAGPVLLTLFLDVRGYRVLGSRETVVQANGAFNDGTPLSSQAIYDRDPWSYAGGVGIRFRWLPVPD